MAIIYYYGGDTILRLKSILKITPNGTQDYQHLVAAIEFISRLMNNLSIDTKPKKKTRQWIKGILNDLIASTNDTLIHHPDYFNKLLASRVDVLPKRIELDYDVIVNEWDWLNGILSNIKNIFKLFAKSECISIVMPSDHVMDKEYTHSMVHDLYSISYDDMPSIQLEFKNISKKSKFMLVNAVNSKAQSHEKYQWTIKPKGTGVCLQCSESSDEPFVDMDFEQPRPLNLGIDMLAMAKANDTKHRKASLIVMDWNRLGTKNQLIVDLINGYLRNCGADVVFIPPLIQHLCLAFHLNEEDSQRMDLELFKYRMLVARLDEIEKKIAQDRRIRRTGRFSI